MKPILTVVLVLLADALIAFSAFWLGRWHGVAEGRQQVFREQQEANGGRK
jgi:hypothetical protein